LTGKYMCLNAGKVGALVIVVSTLGLASQFQVHIKIKIPKW